MGAIQFLSVNDCCCICVQGSTDVRGTGHMRVRRRLAAAGMGSGLPWGDGDERRLQVVLYKAGSFVKWDGAIIGEDEDEMASWSPPPPPPAEEPTIDVPEEWGV